MLIMRFSGDEGVLVMNIPALRGNGGAEKESNRKMRGSGDINLYIYPSTCELSWEISSKYSALIVSFSPKVKPGNSQLVKQLGLIKARLKARTDQIMVS